ncbi:RDD family protein, partial [Silvibacterium sp.]|uniref:RDD family protein n=1 Tax=Silvibacterium sp. TaxID=1964179 RepID=UPI0039E72A53
AAEAIAAARAAEAAAEAARAAQSAAQAILAGLDLTPAEYEAAHAQPEWPAEPAEIVQMPLPEAVNSFPVAAASYAPAPEMSRAVPTASAFVEEPVVHAPIDYRVHPDSLPQAPQNPARGVQNRVSETPRSQRTEDYPTHIEDPFEEAFVADAQPLPAKLIEFPRELVATRKARPRLAEGPLREEAEPEGAQLRIFEVEPESISHEVTTQQSSSQALPEWHSIQLDPHPESEAEPRPLGRQSRRDSEAQVQAGQAYSALMEMLPLHVAPMQDRIMATLVDVALVSIAFLLFVLVFVASTPHLPTGKPALAAAGAVLGVFFVIYQWLFFSFSEGTPGMQYAKIALCTFEDENPTRKEMRGRIAALLLSALPLGLGFLWAFLDDDRLSWHDRITRTYQRSYR